MDLSATLLGVGLVLAAAGSVIAGRRIASAVDRARQETTVRHLQGLFAPARAAARDDPAGILAWQGTLETSRHLFPEAHRRLDAAAPGGQFPFSRDLLSEAHTRWTTEWLAWERAHDAEYALKAEALQAELQRTGEATTRLGRTRVAALEEEKLTGYQERYEQYIRTARALQTLVDGAS